MAAAQSSWIACRMTFRSKLLIPGTTTALLGRSGSGKTTLMRMVNAMAMPTAGERAASAARATLRAWNLLELRRGIGYVIQETGLFPHWTVERNVGHGSMELAGTEQTGEIAGRVQRRCLQLVGLERRALRTRFPWQLSGGQRQRAWAWLVPSPQSPVCC